ncbi:hypothetical protein IID23_03140 [Patescibacteria group bacterium]|nr:hypothetical protein [Patescibacteria group bacterium]
MVLHWSNVGPPVSRLSITSVGPAPWVVIFEFEVAEQPLRHICFTKRPKELYSALTTVLDRKWKGDKIEFTGGGYVGSIERHAKTYMLLVIEISAPYALRFELSLELQEINAMRNKMAIILAE